MPMFSKNPFYRYCGNHLAMQLPYEKKGFIRKEYVCEWQAVHIVGKAGFYLGCALAIADSKLADSALWNASRESPLSLTLTNADWRYVFEEVLVNIENRLKCIKGAKKYDYTDLFPETKEIKNPEMLLNADACFDSVGQRVLVGLLFGVAHPDYANMMLRVWIDRGNLTLSEGIDHVNTTLREEIDRKLLINEIELERLLIQDKRLLTSIDDVKEMAISIYKDWDR
jgi:hypothetical protein